MGAWWRLLEHQTRWAGGLLSRVQMLNVAGTERFIERLNGKVLEAFGVTHSGACQGNELLCHRGRLWVVPVNQTKGAQDRIVDVAENSNLIKVK
jgi:hypothetical protein